MMPRRAFIGGAALHALVPLAARARPRNDALDRGLRFRIQAVGSLTNALETTPFSQAAIGSFRLPGVALSMLNPMYRYFFTASQVMLGHAGSRTPILGFYSALVDAWWLAILGPDGKFDQARLSVAPLFDTARHDSSGTLADFTRYGAVDTLRGRTANALSDFRAEFGQESTSPPGAFMRVRYGQEISLVVRDRLVALAASVDGLGADQAAMQAWSEVIAALAEPIPFAPASLTLNAASQFLTLASQPQLLRSGHAPLLALRHSNGWTVASGSATAGSQLLFCRINSGRQQPVSRIALVDLSLT
jgi:hypothetical protein